jgi:hypothetical protein
MIRNFKERKTAGRPRCGQPTNRRNWLEAARNLWSALNVCMETDLGLLIVLEDSVDSLIECTNSATSLLMISAKIRAALLICC